MFSADLLEGFKPADVLAGRAYDAEHFHDTILELEAIAVIPPRPKRRRPHTDDKEIYKQRNLVEHFFNKLKHFRQLATRYDKLLENYFGFVSLAAIHILLR